MTLRLHKTGIEFPDGSWQMTASSGGVENNTNAILNGDFQVSQRELNSGEGAFSNEFWVDRWFHNCSGNVGRFELVAASIPNTLENYEFHHKAYRAIRPSGQSWTSPVIIGQVIEDSFMYPCVNKVVAISFWARKGTGFSGAGNQIGVLFKNNNNIIFNSNAECVLTDEWQKFEFITEQKPTLGNCELSFQYTPSGTSDGTDYFDLTGVQVEPVKVTPYQYRNLVDELALCQRYFYRGFISASASGSNGTIPNKSYPCNLRTSGTFKIYYGGVTNRVYRTVDAGLKDLVNPVVNGNTTSLHTLYAWEPTNWALDALGINCEVEVNAEFTPSFRNLKTAKLSFILHKDKDGKVLGVTKKENGDSCFIPANEDNNHYQEYIAWTKASPKNVAVEAD